MELITNQILARLERMQIASRSRMRWHRKGEKSSLKKGSSLEFSDYRNYLQGDDVRNIDWNVYARTERLFLKLFFEEESKPVYFVVDGSESMSFGKPSKLEYALSIAAALSYIALRRYDQPRILLLQGRNFANYSFGSRRHFFPVMQQLRTVKPGGETYLDTVLRKIAAGRFQRGIYFLLSDFYSLDDLVGANLLAGAGNELHCLQILSQEEIDPRVRGDLKLIDCESAGHADVSINPLILKHYAARLNQLQDRIRRLAHGSPYGSYDCISTTLALEDLLFRKFREKGLLL